MSMYLPRVQRVYASPARRCLDTTRGIWPDAQVIEEPGLWEQDFGEWEGLPFDQIPDVGALSRQDLAKLAAPGGESFGDLCGRVQPALQKIAGRESDGFAVVVAHAGVVRAGLSLALENPGAGLAFAIDPLSLTRLKKVPDGGFSVRSVNWRPGI